MTPKSTCMFIQIIKKIKKTYAFWKAQIYPYLGFSFYIWNGVVDYAK